MAHTPGPWSQFLDRKAGTVTISPSMRPGEIATVPIAGEGNANAHLIAAAPDLLEALRWFINDIDGTHTVMVEFDANVTRARRAIAKATAA